MAVNWRDLSHSNITTIQMISPSNHTTILGELDGVDLSGSSISMGYYTDTRQQATIKTINSNWKRGSFLKVIHKIPEWNYSKSLGLFAVQNDDASYGISEIVPLQCVSMMHLESLDIAAKPWVIAKGANSTTVLKQLLNASMRKYSIASNVKSGTFKGAYILPAGESALSRYFTICSITGNRLDVNGDGTLTVNPYVAPKNKPVVWTFDLHDEKGIINGGYSRSTNFFELPSRAVVYYEWQDDYGNVRYISQYSDVASGELSAATRGYRVVDFYQVDELNPQTAAQALKLAKQRLSVDSAEMVQWELSNLPYIPLWEGDAVNLVVYDGPQRYRGIRKCLVKSMKLNLGTYTMDLTLKEVTSPEEDEF